MENNGNIPSGNHLCSWLENPRFLSREIPVDQWKIKETHRAKCLETRPGTTWTFFFLAVPSIAESPSKTGPGTIGVRTPKYQMAWFLWSFHFQNIWQFGEKNSSIEHIEMGRTSDFLSVLAEKAWPSLPDRWRTINKKGWQGHTTWINMVYCVFSVFFFLFFPVYDLETKIRGYHQTLGSTWHAHWRTCCTNSKGMQLKQKTINHTPKKW